MTKLAKKILCLALAAIMLTGPVFAEARYTREADILYELGLLKGSESGYELTRECTKVESAVMVVRLLGGEAEALRENNAHPFTDVQGWASPYIGWLYKQRLTTGVSPNVFGAGLKATAQQYSAFLLRALGYSSGKAGDFEYQNTLDFAVIAGLISREQKVDLQSRQFLRDDMVLLSYQALSALLKNEIITLAEKLAAANVIDISRFRIAENRLRNIDFTFDNDGKIRARDSGEEVFVSANLYLDMFEASDYIIARSKEDANLYIITKQPINESPFLRGMNLDPLTVLDNNTFLFRKYPNELKSLLYFNGKVIFELMPAAEIIDNPIVEKERVSLLTKTGSDYNVVSIDLVSFAVKRSGGQDGHAARMLKLLPGVLLFNTQNNNGVSTALIRNGDIVAVYYSEDASNLEIEGTLPYGESKLVYSDLGLFSVNSDGSVFNRLFARPVAGLVAKDTGIYLLVGVGSQTGREIGVLRPDGKYAQLLPAVPDLGIDIAAIEDADADGVYFSNRKQGQENAFHYLLKDATVTAIAYSPVNSGYKAALEQETPETRLKVEQENLRLSKINSSDEKINSTEEKTSSVH